MAKIKEKIRIWLIDIGPKLHVFANRSNKTLVSSPPWSKFDKDFL